MQMYKWFYDSPLGQMTMFGTDLALMALYFSDEYRISFTPDSSSTETLTAVFSDTIKYLDNYFKGRIPDIYPHLELQATPFRLKVYEILTEIAYGQSLTYGQVARQLTDNDSKKIMSAQAVGGAVSHNPVCIIIPCHRVLGADGSLTGYSGGIKRKEQLLKLEKTVTENISIVL